MGPIYRLYGHYLLLDKTDETRKRAPADVCATPRTDNIGGFRGCKTNSRRVWRFPRRGNRPFLAELNHRTIWVLVFLPSLGNPVPILFAPFHFFCLSTF